MKIDERLEVVNSTCEFFGQILQEITDDLNEEDSFKIISNICLRMATFPMNLVADEGLQDYIDGFSEESKKMMQEFVTILTGQKH